MRANRLMAVVASLVVVVLAAGPTEAKRNIKPKAGGYVGKVTNRNGKGQVRLIVATFNVGSAQRKGPQLNSWTGILECDDGSTRDVTSIIFAPLTGAKFSSKMTDGSQTTRLNGRFTANTKLKGTVRVVTKGATPAEKCHTGAVTFKAHRR